MPAPQTVPVRLDNHARTTIQIPDGPRYVWSHPGAILLIPLPHMAEVQKYMTTFGLKIVSASGAAHAAAAPPPRPTKPLGLTATDITFVLDSARNDPHGVLAPLAKQLCALHQEIFGMAVEVPAITEDASGAIEVTAELVEAAVEEALIVNGPLAQRLRQRFATEVKQEMSDTEAEQRLEDDIGRTMDENPELMQRIADKIQPRHEPAGTIYHTDPSTMPSAVMAPSRPSSHTQDQETATAALLSALTPAPQAVQAATPAVSDDQDEEEDEEVVPEAKPLSKRALAKALKRPRAAA